jgi:hypothetical protein
MLEPFSDYFFVLYRYKLEFYNLRTVALMILQLKLYEAYDEQTSADDGMRGSCEAHARRAWDRNQ